MKGEGTATICIAQIVIFDESMLHLHIYIPTKIYFYSENRHLYFIYIVCGLQTSVQNEMKVGGTVTVLNAQFVMNFMKLEAWVTLAVIPDDSGASTIFLLHDLLGFTVKKH